MLDKDQAREMLDRLVDAQGYQPERRAQEALRLRCMAFYFGKQHFHQTGTTLWEDAPETEHEEIYRANLVHPAVERSVAKVLEVSGDVRVAPKTGSFQDRHGAKVSDQVMDHMLDQTDYVWEKELTLRWASITGDGYLKQEWDTSRGDKTRYYTDASGRAILPDSAQHASELEREGSFRDFPLGDVRSRSVSPFSIHTDWDCRGRLEDARWIAEIHLVSIPNIAETFDLSGKQEKKLQKAGSVPGATTYDQAIAFMTSGAQWGGYGYTPRQQVEEGRAVVTYFYHRPTKRHPKGMYIVRVGDELLDGFPRDNPYRDSADGIPFVKIPWWQPPGRHDGIGLVEHLMPAQFRYNEARAKATEFQGVFGQPPIFAPKGTFPEDTWVAKPGVIHGVEGAKIPLIKGMDAPQFPPEVAQNAAMARGEIDMISSQSDPDMSGAPGQMRSGAALERFFGEKNKTLSTVQRNSVKADVKVGRQLLGLGRVHYDANRVIAYAGDTGQFEVLQFSQTDLHNDVRLYGTPTDADGATAFKSNIADMMEVGALDPINNPADRQLIFNAFRFNTSDEISQDKARDQTEQEREIVEMVSDPAKYMAAPQQGQQEGYPVMGYDNHQVHAATLARFFKTDEFRALDPATQGVLYVHFQNHQAAIKQAMEEQMRMAEASKGTPGQKGAASQPRR